jgi:hypothetical protein
MKSGHPLVVSHSLPLEREFEAWIVRAIEDDLDCRNLTYFLTAVSPTDEKTWPADESLLAFNKLVGLQFKRPHLAASGGLSYSRLRWSLSQPPTQYPLVMKTPEVFYCLPTFVNRTLSRCSLQHALFWRPEPGPDREVWYDNPRAQTAYKRVCDAFRWGRFVEGVLECTIGTAMEEGFSFREYLDGVVRRAERDGESLQTDPRMESPLGSSSVIYFLFLRRSNG